LEEWIGDQDSSSGPAEAAIGSAWAYRQIIVALQWQDEDLPTATGFCKICFPDLDATETNA
jgi:hypothetical protein